MRRAVPPLVGLPSLALLLLATLPAVAQRVTVTLPAAAGREALDGRLVLVVTPDTTGEPRLQVAPGPNAPQVFGLDVDGWRPGTARTLDARTFTPAAARTGAAFGYPLAALADVPAGTYTVQAVLNRYETFRLATGHTVKLPPDRGEGQQWNRKPGNLTSAPQRVRLGPGTSLTLRLDRTIPALAPPVDTEWIKHITVTSERLSRFYGRPMTLGAHVLLPKGWADHPAAHYPLVVNHGHFPDEFRRLPHHAARPDHAVRVERALRRAVLQPRPASRRRTTSTGRGAARTSPAMLIVEIQHANPYYDDSYAVNSANLGPYGDAIMYELIPEIEKKFRGLGQGWARFMYGGSTGGWEALAAQMFYPDAFNGAFAACPDPIDFRSYAIGRPLRRRERLLRWTARSAARARPATATRSGASPTPSRDENHLRTRARHRGRSGGQWDIWQAVYSPQGPDGYPLPIWDKRTGADRPQPWPITGASITTCATSWSATGRRSGRSCAARCTSTSATWTTTTSTTPSTCLQDFLRTASTACRRRRWPTATATSTAGTATRPFPTASPACATTPSTCPA